MDWGDGRSRCAALSAPDSRNVFHVICGSGFPVALQVNVTRSPSTIVWFADISMIVGSTSGSSERKVQYCNRWCISYIVVIQFTNKRRRYGFSLGATYSSHVSSEFTTFCSNCPTMGAFNLMKNGVKVVYIQSRPEGKGATEAICPGLRGTPNAIKEYKITLLYFLRGRVPQNALGGSMYIGTLKSFYLSISFKK